MLFADPVHAAAFRALAAADTLPDAIGAAEPEAAALLQRIVVEEEPDPDSDAAIQVIRLAGNRVVKELGVKARSSPTAESPLGWVKLHVELLDNPDSRVDAAAQLVAWLADRVEESGVSER